MITPDYIFDMAQDSLPRETLGSKTELIQAFIDNAISTVELHIGRKLGVLEYRESVQLEDWEYTSLGWRITTAIFPVTECEGATAIGKSWVVFEDRTDEITYKAGWVTLPANVKLVLFNLTMYEINRSRGNTYNFTTKTQVTGSTISNVTKSPEDFYRDELKRLDMDVMMSYNPVEVVEHES
jgi:hypothetical protein